MRSLISRGTLLVLAVALLYGGVRSIRYGTHLREEHVRQFGPPTSSRRDYSGAFYFWLFGTVLLGGGAVAMAGALLPISLLEQFVSPPRTFDDDFPDNHRRP
jgi:hypothetical protein